MTQKTYKTVRSVRLVPEVRSDTESFFVTELAETVKVDGAEFQTAPIKNGTTVYLMGLTHNLESLLQTGVVDSTDGVDNKATLEAIWLNIGGQFFKLHVGVPFVEHGYKQLEIDTHITRRLTFGDLDVNHNRIDGLARFLDANISIELALNIRANINAAVVEACSNTLITSVRAVFPDDQPALRDHNLRSRIQDDVAKIEMQVVGTDFDISRHSKYVPPQKQHNTRGFVASHVTLATRQLVDHYATK